MQQLSGMLLLNNVTRCPLIEGQIEKNRLGQERSWCERGWRRHPWCIEPWVLFVNPAHITLITYFFTHLNDRGKMHVAYSGPFYLFPEYSSVVSSAFVLCVPSPPMFRAVSSFQTEALSWVKISFLAPSSHCWKGTMLVSVWPAYFIQGSLGLQDMSFPKNLN